MSISIERECRRQAGLHCVRSGAKVGQACGCADRWNSGWFKGSELGQQQIHAVLPEIDNLMYRTQKSVSMLAVLSILSGCGGSQVFLQDPSIPEALIEKMPLKVAGRYPENFQHYVHEETVAGKEKWTIDLGKSHEMLFSQLFRSMFSEYQVIDADTDPRDLGLDAVIEPSVEAFEFSVPHQTKTDEFAVWIRYRIKVFDSQGNQIANWPISAYGKSQTTTMGGDAALRRAAVLAMRDAAALVIMQMDKSTGISKLGAARNPAPAVQPAEAPELQQDEMLQSTTVEESPDDPG